METIKSLLENNIVYNVLIPLLILFLKFIESQRKSRRDMKMLQSWKYTPKKFCPFHEVFMLFEMVALISLLPSSAFENYFNCEIRFIYLAISSTLSSTLYLIIFCVLLKINMVREEFLKYRKFKTIFCLFFGFLLTFSPIFIILLEEIKGVEYDVSWAIAFLFIFLFSNYMVYSYSDKILIYNEKYANIYINNGDIVKMVFVETIERRGKWIYAWHMDDKKGMCDIRIKEELIERIDYFGGELIVVEDPQQLR